MLEADNQLKSALRFEDYSMSYRESLTSFQNVPVKATLIDSNKLELSYMQVVK